MEDLLLQLVDSTSSGIVSYAVVFGILLLCGLGVPLPEDVSLILGGYLVFSGKARLLLMMITGFAGILMGDSIIFVAGRRIGSQIGARPSGFFARIASIALVTQATLLSRNLRHFRRVPGLTVEDWTV